MNIDNMNIEELKALRITLAEEVNTAGKAKQTVIVNEKMAEWRIVNKHIIALENILQENGE